MYVLFLTADFVTMFEEDKWPDDPIEYARGFLGSTSREDIDAAVAENARLKTEVQALEAQVQRQIDTLDG
jgi:hypothetical protein